MSDKDFKVKNKLQVKGITSAGPVVSDASGNLDSTSYIATQYGGTGTSTSPTSGQVLYSSSGTTYSPTTLSSLVTPITYSADAPSSPVTGQIWVESDSSSTAFDPNIIRRQSFTATAGQTVFTTSISFIDGYEQVYFNGMLLLKTTDYTTSNNNTITLTAAAALNDILEVVTVTNLNSVNTYTQAEIDSKILTAVPSQTGNSGKYLTTNGSITSWGTVSGYSAPTIGSTSITSGSTVTNINDLTINSTTIPSSKTLVTTDSTAYVVPSQTGNSGKYLTTNGTTASWASIASGGKLLQVVEGQYATQASTTSTSYSDTGLSATITPSSSSSKVLIIVAQWLGKQGGSNADAVGVQLLRGSTVINAGGMGAQFYMNSSTWMRASVILMALDSPNTTSATTYKTQFNSNSSGNSTYAQIDNYRSSIILMEIGA